MGKTREKQEMIRKITMVSKGHGICGFVAGLAALVDYDMIKGPAWGEDKKKWVFEYITEFLTYINKHDQGIKEDIVVLTRLLLVKNDQSFTSHLKNISDPQLIRQSFRNQKVKIALPIKIMDSFIHYILSLLPKNGYNSPLTNNSNILEMKNNILGFFAKWDDAGRPIVNHWAYSYRDRHNNRIVYSWGKEFSLYEFCKDRRHGYYFFLPTPFGYSTAPTSSPRQSSPPFFPPPNRQQQMARHIPTHCRNCRMVLLLMHRGRCLYCGKQN